MQQQLNQPFQTILELSLPARVTIPELVLRHRDHHGAPTVDSFHWAEDKRAWKELKQEQREVLLHVLTRFGEGMKVAAATLPTLERAARNGREFNPGVYAALQEDTHFLSSACSGYQDFVAGAPSDRRAITPGFQELFFQSFPSRERDLVSALSCERTSQIRAEARLRTLYHVIGEGLGALTGIWGLNAALRELSIVAEDAPTKILLPGLAQIVAQITLVERRNIAFGLSELGRLARENYFATVLPALREFKADRPILERMRDETFSRWGESFPFAIDKEQLATQARKRVLGWLGDHVLVRSSFMPRKRMRELASIA